MVETALSAQDLTRIAYGTSFLEWLPHSSMQPLLRYLSVYIWFDRKVTEGKQMWARIYNKAHCFIASLKKMDCIINPLPLTITPFSLITEIPIIVQNRKSGRFIIQETGPCYDASQEPRQKTCCWAREALAKDDLNCEFYDFSEIYPGKDLSWADMLRFEMQSNVPHSAGRIRRTQRGTYIA